MKKKLDSFMGESMIMHERLSICYWKDKVLLCTIYKKLFMKYLSIKTIYENRLLLYISV